MAKEEAEQVVLVVCEDGIGFSAGLLAVVHQHPDHGASTLEASFAA